jgi:hypothetical protein
MVNDVLHGERIVDGTAVRKWLDRASASIVAAWIVRIPEIPHRSNFNKIRMARRTAFSNVMRMVAFGE